MLSTLVISKLRLAQYYAARAQERKRVHFEASRMQC
jgi:hypothetical protein